MPDVEFRSEFFGFAHAYVEKSMELSPIRATRHGDTRFDDRLDDFSPAQSDRDQGLLRWGLSCLQNIRARDDIDRIGMALMKERLSSRLAVVESGEERRAISILSSPASHIRGVFEMQPAESKDHAETVRARLGAVRGALAGWQMTLDDDSASGIVPARRQSLGVAAQLETYAMGAFSMVSRRAAASCGVDADASGLVAAGVDADRACGELAEWLRRVHVPRAKDADAVGRERYLIWAQVFNGTSLDLEELYRWGWEDLCSINARMWEIARELAPDATVLSDVAAALDADESRAVYGPDVLVDRLRALTTGAVEMLDGVHFDIDERIRFCDARIAPEGAAGAPYYTGPSEDLGRPGITWYPTLGHVRFPMWRVVSTWYHESVPGHHLQVATAILQKERQSRFQRLEGSVSAYGEGWALYAERLMEELGAFTDLGNEMGYLSKQAMRAARVVVDIGMHLELAAPDDIGPLGPLGEVAGRVWDAEMAVGLLVERALVARDRAVSEVDRYLGRPAQAISYKVGERGWLQCREQARNRLGPAFDLKAWHASALALGPMGLDAFAAEMSLSGTR
ncbi:MAG: DUF885 domain-containing protein [Acidimicrobiales bacterium]